MRRIIIAVMVVVGAAFITFVVVYLAYLGGLGCQPTN